MKLDDSQVSGNRRERRAKQRLAKRATRRAIRKSNRWGAGLGIASAWVKDEIEKLTVDRTREGMTRRVTERQRQLTRRREQQNGRAHSR